MNRTHADIDRSAPIIAEALTSGFPPDFVPLRAERATMRRGPQNYEGWAMERKGLRGRLNGVRTNQQSERSSKQSRDTINLAFEAHGVRSIGAKSRSEWLPDKSQQAQCAHDNHQTDNPHRDTVAHTLKGAPKPGFARKIIPGVLAARLSTLAPHSTRLPAPTGTDNGSIGEINRLSVVLERHL